MDTFSVLAITEKTRTELDGMRNCVKRKIKRVQRDGMDRKFVPNT